MSFFIKNLLLYGLKGETKMIQTITYFPKGTCSAKMVLSIDDKDDRIVDFEVVGGCPGNLAGIKRLIIGMDCKVVAEKLSGTTCRSKPTSCPDQLSKAIMSYLEGKKN